MGDTRRIKRENIRGQMPSNRVLGKYGRGIEGSSLIITADILGNEFGGVLAFLNVLDVLEKLNLSIKGELVGLAGNTRIGQLMDRNRPLFPETETFLRLREEQGYNRGNEFLDLYEEYEKYRNAESTGLFYMDIKNCPSLRQPYVCINRGFHNSRFAEGLALCTVKGLEDFVPDHMGFNLNAKGYTGCTLKVGHHCPLPSLQVQEAAIWMALVNSGCLDKEEVPDFSLCHKTLRDCKGNKEAASFEVIYRYRIQEDEFFRMIPGYVNFQKISKGETLATSDGGPVISQWDGRIFMPLYHIKSLDGFFILREEE